MDCSEDDGNLSNSTADMDVKPTVLQRFIIKDQFKKTLDTATADFSRASISVEQKITEGCHGPPVGDSGNLATSMHHEESKLGYRELERDSLSQAAASKSGGSAAADFMHTPINEEF
jgi:hypothetical protein